MPGHVPLPLGGTQNGEHVAGAALLHGAGGDVHVQSPLFQQAGAGEGQGFGGHVVDVAYQLQNLPAGSLRGLSQEGPDAVGLFKLLGPDAHAHGLGGHHRHGAEGLGEVGEQSSTGGGTQLPPDRPAINGNPGEKVGGGGSGDGHDAVGAPHRAAAHMDGGGQDLVGLEQVQGVAHPHHVGHRVQGPHLVEVHVPHGAAMGLGLRLGDGIVHPSGVGFYLLGQGEAVDDGSDVARGGVVVMMVVLLPVVVAVAVLMPMIVLVFVVVVVMFFPVAVEMGQAGGLRGGGLSLLLAVHRHCHVGARDAAGGGPLGLQAHPGEPQAVHSVQEPLLVLQQFIQGGHEHISGGPHIAFQIKRFHFIPPDLPFD